MSERREFTDTAPAQPIVLRPHLPEFEPRALVEPRLPRSHLTRRRIMYLVGLLLQASVLAMLLAGFLAYEAPIRAAVGLPPAEAPLAASLAALGADVADLSGRVEALATAVGADPAAGEATGSLTQQVGQIAQALSRLEARSADAAAAPAAAQPAP